MPSLKDLKIRIESVKSTRKITSAMKMVASSKLRRAQSQAEEGQPYAKRMGRMMGALAANAANKPGAPALLAGTGKSDTHLVIVITANRGLCGGFNSYAARKGREKMSDLIKQGKNVKLITVGRKGYDALKGQYEGKMVARYDDHDKPNLSFDAADMVSDKVMSLFEKGGFDVCSLVYNRFISVLTQEPTVQQLIPFEAARAKKDDDAIEAKTGALAQYEFEPSEQGILDNLLPRNLAVQIFTAMLDSGAGEHAARMTAMDNATRNAGEMIDDLTLTYNRTRQAFITRELIEIISGAEAV